MTKVAIAFSMIVLITSLTPRVTLSSAAMPAQAAPDRHRDDQRDRRSAGSPAATLMKPRRPTAAASIAASRYWPSTPMLNRFILNPMATATRGQVVDRGLVDRAER